MRAAGHARHAAASGALALVLLGGCGAEEPLPGPSSPATSSPASTDSSPQVPTVGPSLRQLGFTHGPVDAFSVPPGSVLSVRVDQPNVVSLVFSYPPPAEVDGYLHQTLPAAGFAITDENDAGTTFSFAGHGWSGSFTAARDTSAVVIRPD